jgi:hypothetical protein
MDSMATVFYSFIAQDIPTEPSSVSGRILVLSVCINGGVLFWSYSAGLVSFLTVEKYEYPIKTLNVSSLITIPFYNNNLINKHFKVHSTLCLQPLTNKDQPVTHRTKIVIKFALF